MSHLGECVHRICLTPTRNEGWIIKTFLRAARTWASHVFVADQNSNDGTWQALQNLSGVYPIVNDSREYDEEYRQRLLLRKAREVIGKRILFALDADEMLSANFAATADWKRVLAAAPGTILRFRWANVLPGFEQVWIPHNRIVCGFVDDGTEHVGCKIHSPRIPEPEGAPILDCDDIVVLHFQYVLWDRMLSKQRWYQAWERATHRCKSPLQVFREYNHMLGGWGDDEIFPLQSEWLAGYEGAGINFRMLECEPVTWWDREVVRMLAVHGADYFRRIAIWDKDWNSVARCVGVNGSFDDPRSRFEKWIHYLLAQTQSRRSALSTRIFERFLRTQGW